MKYLQIVSNLAQDLTDQSYNDITVPSVRLIKDTNEVVARTTSNNNLDKVLTFGELANLTPTTLSGITMSGYINGLSAGTYTSEYVKGLTDGCDYDTYHEFFNSTLDGVGFKSCMPLVEQMMLNAFRSYGSYDAIEEALTYALAYQEDYDYDMSYSTLESGATESETKTYNEYEEMTELLDFNYDGQIDANDLAILVAYKKFFPEYVTEAGYKAAKDILDGGEYAISDVIDSLLGIEEYNEDFDFNGNGIVDEEDMCFFISYHIFGDEGISSDATSARKVIRKSAEMDTGVDIDKKSLTTTPPVRTNRTGTSSAGDHHHAVYRVTGSYTVEVIQWTYSYDFLTNTMQTRSLTISNTPYYSYKEYEIHTSGDGERDDNAAKTLMRAHQGEVKSMINGKKSQRESYWDKRSNLAVTYSVTYSNISWSCVYVGKSSRTYPKGQ